MGDRLSEALTTVISNTNDKKTKRILQAVLELSDEIYYMDYNDWIEYINSDDFDKDMLSRFMET